MWIPYSAPFAASHYSLRERNGGYFERPRSLTPPTPNTGTTVPLMTLSATLPIIKRRTPFIFI